MSDLERSQHKPGQPSDFETNRKAADEPLAGASPESQQPRVVDASELMGGGQELLIRHGADLYRLRLTRNGKLLLHK